MTPLTVEETAWRRWAADQLSVPVEASVPQVRAEFFKRLAAEDFVPSPTLRHAFVLLDHATEDCPKRRSALLEARQAQQDALDAAVEAFAQEFWKRKPSAREVRWNELMAAASWFPRLRTRLESLKTALSVEASPGQCDTETARELVERLQTLAVCRPLERAVLLEDLLRRRQENTSWKLVARQVQAQFPQLAELGAGVLGELAEPAPKPAKPLRGKLKSEVETPRPTRDNRPFLLRHPAILIFVVLTSLRVLTQGGCNSNYRPVTRDAKDTNEQMERWIEGRNSATKQTRPSSK